MTDSCQIHFIERVFHKKRDFLALFSQKKVFPREHFRKKILFFSIFFLIFEQSITCKIGKRLIQKIFSTKMMQSALKFPQQGYEDFLNFQVLVDDIFQKIKNPSKRMKKTFALEIRSRSTLREKEKFLNKFSATRKEYFSFFLKSC